MDHSYTSKPGKRWIFTLRESERTAMILEIRLRQGGHLVGRCHLLDQFSRYLLNCQLRHHSQMTSWPHVKSSDASDGPSVPIRCSDGCGESARTTMNLIQEELVVSSHSGQEGKATAEGLWEYVKALWHSCELCARLSLTSSDFSIPL